MKSPPKFLKAGELFPECESSSWYRKEMPESADFDQLFDAYLFRKTAPGKVEAVIETNGNSANIQNGLHGGFLAARVEQLLYLPLYVNRCVKLGGVVIIDFNIKFLRGGQVGPGLSVEIELMHETGRLGFTRGVVTQHGNPLVSFSATIRKLQ